MWSPERILVIRTDRIGDVVLATPLIRALRAAFPDSYLAAMVRPYARDVLLHNPRLDEIILDDPAGEHSGRAGFWRQVRFLRSRNFDTALLLLPTQRLAWMLFWAGIRTRIGEGTRLYQVLTFMRSVNRHKYIPLRHEADYCLDLGRRLGVVTDDLSPELFLTDAERARGLAILRAAGIGEERNVIALHPGSGRSSPNWPPERYAELASQLLENGRSRPHLLLLGEDDASPFPHHPGLVDLRGRRSLREFISILSHVHCLFSASTGPMHLAAALRVPTVSIFCPLPACSPTLWGPQGNDARVLLPPEGFCQGRCPGDPKICGLDELSPRRAADAVRNVLGLDG